MKKNSLLIALLVVMMICGLASSVNLGMAQTTLSVPELTVTYADLSYDVPASTIIDPYTGKTVEILAQRVENRTIQFTIKNQAFGNGQLYYVVRMKGHFSDNWSNISRVSADRESASTVLVYTSSGDGRFYFHGESFSGLSTGSSRFSSAGTNVGRSYG